MKSIHDDEQIATAVGLTLAGETQAEAGRVAGIPQQTVSRHLKTLGLTGDQAREDRLRAAEEAILDQSIQVAQTALVKIQELIDSGKLKSRELVAAYSAATDRVGKFRGWGKGEAGTGDGINSLAQTLAKLPQGGTISVTVDPGSQHQPEPPIDVGGSRSAD